MTLIQKILLSSLLLSATASMAEETRLAVPMNYHLIRSLLVSQLYTGEQETARLWKEGKECSFLDVSNPQLSGDKGQIKLGNNVHARLGLPLAGKCISALEWNGTLQTWQQPTLDATGNVLRFPVTRTEAFDTGGQPLKAQKLQDLLNKAVQQKLSDLKIDLNQSRGDIIKTVLPYIDAADTEALQDTVNSLRFNQAEADDKALTIGIGFVGQSPDSPATQAVPAFTAHELKQWRAVWRGLEQNLETAMAQAGADKQTQEDSETLHGVLADARTAFEQGLSATEIDAENDPVRQFFNTSWDKLGPLLRRASTRLPGAEALQYLTLIAATDVMYQLDSFTRPLGLEVSAYGLRKLARAYLHHEAGLAKPKRSR